MLATTVSAEILHEQGSLRGFLGGTCPNCAYDNWISHISEGIARANFNDYGPLSLDPQTNGFGHYVPLVDSGGVNSPVTKWYNIFRAFFVADTHRIDSLLTATALDSIYDLVILADSTREYYLLREHLNPAYYDSQQTPADSSDDVRGSFDGGWGVYILSPTAARANILIEAPHPEDDFLTPWISTDVLQLWDAGSMMVAGAGREVLWTEQGTYDNTKSLSDPTRIAASVFHAAHRAFVDTHSDNFALQLHSYDTRTHPNRKSLVLSAGADDGFPNEPLLDRCAYDDMISLTPLIAVPANVGGDHPNVTVGNYYSVFYEGGYAYQGTTPTISTNIDLSGYSQNQQMLYSHIGHDDYRSAENFVHVEMDELPDALTDSAAVFYRTDLPGGITFANYEYALDYFRPAYTALLEALSRAPMVQMLEPVPSLLNIGNVAVHATETRRVVFHNITSADTLRVLGASINLSAFSLSNVPTGAVLSPGAACSLSVSFTPNAANSYSAVLRLSTNQGCLHMQVIGTGSGASITLTPDSLSFDTLEVGVRDTLNVTCHNGGNATLRLYAFVNSSPAARILSVTDSSVSGHGNKTLRIEFHPLDVGAAICSVGVLSNAYNLDTAWVTVTGTGTALPRAVQGLVILRHDSNSVILSWPPSDSTGNGFPLLADGYIVLGRAHFNDSSTVIGNTSDTSFVHTGTLDSAGEMFYQVVAYYGNTLPPLSSGTSPPHFARRRD